MVERSSGGPFAALGGVVELTADVRARRPHPEHVGCVSLVDGDLPHLAMVPDVSPTMRRDLEQWAADRVGRLRAQGPELEGWGVWILEDGRMAAQLWVRPVRVPTRLSGDPYRTGPRTRVGRRSGRPRSQSDSRR